jgi:DNA-directed RNA polymerase specialized sigma24 family protein
MARGGEDLTDGSGACENRCGLAFPLTHRSVVLAASSSDLEERARALDALVAAYWRPAYVHLRARFGASDEDAQDLAQGFFTAVLEKSLLAGFDPGKGRFRTFLLACLDAFAAKERRAARRMRRGGAAIHVPLDITGEDREVRPHEVAAASDVESEFEREWARSLFALGVEALRLRCQGTPRQLAFTLFERYDLEGSDAPARPRYAELASEHGLPVTQVTNHLAWARREFRATVLRKLREITASEAEFRSEARALLGVDPE